MIDSYNSLGFQCLAALLLAIAMGYGRNFLHARKEKECGNTGLTS